MIIRLLLLLAFMDISNAKKLTLEDAPLIFYKIANSFDRFEVLVQQSLITTTGFQVNDYFYILPQDLERLRSSGFEEVVKRSLSDPPSHN